MDTHDTVGRSLGYRPDQHAESARRKRIGRAIGRSLPMPVCRLLTWAAQRWTPALYRDALREAELHNDGRDDA